MQFYGYRRDGKVLRQVIVTKQPDSRATYNRPPSPIPPCALPMPTWRG